MQLPSATSAMQAMAALCMAVIAGTVFYFNFHTWSDNRNAQLVQIGVSILEIDPKQQTQVKAAREWALNLIEANAGGVTFSPEARAQLLEKQLVTQTPGPNTRGLIVQYCFRNSEEKREILKCLLEGADPTAPTPAQP